MNTDYTEKRQRAADRRARRRENVAFIAATSTRVLPSHSGLEEALDRAFSIFIRNRDTRANAGLCRICDRRPIEVCFHWIPRGHHGVRWDPENACGSCDYCNKREQRRRGLFRHLYIIMFGEEKRLALESKAREAVNYTTADLAEKLDYFTKENRGECSR